MQAKSLESGLKWFILSGEGGLMSDFLPVTLRRLPRDLSAQSQHSIRVGALISSFLYVVFRLSGSAAKTLERAL